MRTLGISHPVVISPIFDDEMYGQIGRYLAAVDIDLVASGRVGDALDAPQPPPLVPLEAVLRVARELYTANAASADGIWISGAAMPSVTVIEALEDELSVPVLSSAQAMMWAGLRTIGIKDEIPGFGRLLRSA
jgi:maleate cis-trans isomerase